MNHTDKPGRLGSSVPPLAVTIRYLPDQAILRAGSIYEAATGREPSASTLALFALALGWYESGAIARAGSFRRFAVGYRTERAGQPVGYGFGPCGPFRAAYRLILKAEAMGLLAGDPLPVTEPAPAPRQPRQKRQAPKPVPRQQEPEPEVQQQEPEPKPARKKPAGPSTVWEEILDAYEAHAPATWARIKRRPPLSGSLPAKLREATDFAGGGPELVALVASALRSVPPFYRDTYPTGQGGRPRPASDFLLCLFSGDSRRKDLGVSGWRLFEWADLLDVAPTATEIEAARIEKRKTIPAMWFGNGWRYGTNCTTPEERRKARQDLAEYGDGPHADWDPRCFWARGMFEGWEPGMPMH